MMDPETRELLDLMAEQQTTYFRYLQLKARKLKLDVEYAKLGHQLEALEARRVKLAAAVEAA
jgi:hypothetical protein